MIKYQGSNASRSFFPLSHVKVTPVHFRPIMVSRRCGGYNRSQDKKGRDTLLAVCLLESKQKQFIVMNITHAKKVTMEEATGVASMSGQYSLIDIASCSTQATKRMAFTTV